MNIIHYIKFCIIFFVLSLNLGAQENEDKYWFTFSDSWIEIGANIKEITSSGNDFYMIGSFGHLTGKPIVGIGKYNPSSNTWMDLDSGLYGYSSSPGMPRDFAVMPNGEVYVGDGDYYFAGRKSSYAGPFNALEGAKFSNGVWSKYPTPYRAGILIATENGELILLGDKGYKWDGSSFQVMSEKIGGINNGGINHEYFKTRDDYIYFMTPDSSDYKLYWICSFNTKTLEITKLAQLGEPSNPNNLFFKINAMAFDDDGNIYIGGLFWQINKENLTVNNVAKWDANAQAWTGLGNGLYGEVLSLEIGINGELYAGGKFTKSGEINLNHVAVWDGNNWDSLGTGIDGEVKFIEVDNSGRVYFAGTFTQAGGKDTRFLARWDKSASVEKPKLIVNTTDDKFDGSCDDDHCSLRDAIYVANQKRDKDTIKFNINNGGEATIELDSALPDVINPVFIDGTTQPGYALKPLIRIDGNKILNYSNGIEIRSGYSEIKGLSVTRFKGYGLLLIENGYNNIYSNFIGIDKNMAQGLENKAGGINISFNSSHNNIGDLDDMWNMIYGGVVINDIAENSGNRIVNNSIEVPLDKLTDYPLRVPIDLADDGPSCNCWEGCGLINKGIAPPRILKLENIYVSGMTIPQGLVEVYVAEELGEKNGRYFARKVYPTAHGYANSEGYFNIPINFQSLNDEFHFVLTATDTEGNTSELSQAKRPVVFVPGIGGSWLIASDGTELWLPDGTTDATQNNNLFRMSLWPNGISKEPVTAPRIIESAAYVATVAYGHILTWLGDKGGFNDNPNDSTMNDIWRFPYDFRLDLEGRAVDLKNMIDRATSDNRNYAKSCEVDILSHSMGGVIPSLYLKDYPKSGKDKVNRLITIGTPYLGAAQAMGAHLKGYVFGLEDAPIYGSGFDVRWDKMIEMARNMTSSYALMPSRKYWEASTQFDLDEYLIPNLDGNPLLSYEATRTFLGAGKYAPNYTPSEFYPFGLNRNIGLLDREENNVHNDKVDDWRTWNGPPQIFRIAGRIKDIGQAARYRSTTIYWYLNPRFLKDLNIEDIPVEDRLFEPGDDMSAKSRIILYRSLLQPVLGDGDGTVPISSATLGNDKRTGKMDFSGANESKWIENFYIFPCSHMGLVEEDCQKALTGEKVFDRIKEILKSGTTLNYQIVPTPATEGKQEILYITASAPVTVSVFDSKMNHTGPVEQNNLNKVEYNLNGIGYWYNSFGATVMLPDLDDYKVVVQSPFKDAEVQFIRLIHQENDKLINVFYKDQKLMTESQLIYEYKPAVQSINTSIGIDTDGNSSIDETIEPSANFESSSSVPSIPIPKPFIFDIGLFANETDTKYVKINIPNTGESSWNWSLKNLPSWVMADKATGTSPSDINLTLNIKNFQPGLYSDTLILELVNQEYKTEYPVIININVYADEDVAKIEIEPEFMMLNFESQFQFSAKAFNQKGEEISTVINWESIGGTISQSGLYTSGSTSGIFKIIAKGPGNKVDDTVEVIVDNTVAVEDKLKFYYEINKLFVKIYPNPLSEFSIFYYQLSVPGRVKIDIYNSIGEKITSLVDEYKDVGNHQADFNANGLSQGMYYYTAQIGEKRESGKIILVK